MSEQIFLEAAIKIGERLVKNAIWHDKNCTWNILAPDRSNRASNTPVKELAEGTVYQGTAGIALFLNQLYKITQEKKYKTVAIGALEHAFTNGENIASNSFGFHSGRVGIAYSLFDGALSLNIDKFHSHALKLLAPLQGNEEKDFGVDVIGGAGGAIQPLLKFYQYYNDNRLLDCAVRLGDNLINIASMEPIGFSWGNSFVNYRNLCGYAHGAAGIGHAFLELFNITGDGKYLFAFEQSVEYENQFYSKEHLNWPDFRYRDLSEYIYDDRIDELKDILHKNELPVYQLSYMTAWCYGSPGIALNRIRAFELLGSEKYKNDSICSLEGTINSLKNYPHQNYSLCHGIGGNSDALIYAANVFNSSVYLEIAKEMALRGIKKFEHKNVPWPCGTIDRVSDPSLMLGEAGIGYYLLRLYSARIPQILAITTNKLENKHTGIDENYKKMNDYYHSRYFGNTITGISKLFNHSIVIENSVSHTYNTLNDYINNLAKDDKELTSDLFNAEQIKYLNALNLADFTKKFRENLIKKDLSQTDCENAKISLNDNVALIENKYEWENWFSSNTNGKMKPDKEENFQLVYNSGNQIQIQKLNSFAATIIFCITKKNSLDEVIEDVLSFFDAYENYKVEIKEKIIMQIVEFYKAGYIKIDKKAVKRNLTATN